MELPVLEKFCFIFDLRTGCMVMGIVHSIITLVLALVVITFASELKAAEREGEGVSVVYTIAVMVVVLLCLKFLLNLVFVYAVHKDKTAIMKKYCIFWVILLVLFVIGFLKTMSHMSAGHVIAQIVFIAENVYNIIIIRSYLMSINEDGVL
ncbi:uncharacterized protein LOC121734584 isoform X2 [Aricia agestis]|nr:uncharacterized protein LOC121734584 isoform X2 [Aricia agestis]